ncbi:BQ2448_1707 [Microbotryum intermedium]|uniref:BQ2448_1707 protein n=1 Tax=Microbotryum intermedium TaxID=269621 RepID=A0A238FE72_9BASI|nr:BQ2448_1707 [Microbotryum intermedium]
MSRIARDNQLKTPYNVLDTDPHATRVIKYMRPADYAAWGGMTAAAPLAFYGLELADPTKMTRAGIRPALRLTAFLGFTGGFLLAYQSSSLRLWGWKENLAEEKAIDKEMWALAKEGKPLYGEETLPPYIQSVAHRNSTWSQVSRASMGWMKRLKFSVMPWQVFNFVRHPHHGVDVSKYETSKEE